MKASLLATATVLACTTVFCFAAPPARPAAPSIEARLAELAPRFPKPEADPAYVMPVGAGDLSAMVRYDQAWEIHLSKTDLFAFEEKAYHKPQTFHSPGHVQLSFGIPREAVRSFEQRLDLHRGSVVLEMKTDEGTVKAEAFGVMGRNTLVVAVDDSRRNPSTTATYSMWRPEMAVSVKDGRAVGREVLEYCENRRPPANPAAVNPADRMYHRGCGTTVAFADGRGLLAATGKTGTQGTDRTASLRPGKPSNRYWLIIAVATTYDGKPEAASATLLEAALKADKAGLLREHLQWWERFWLGSYIDLHGPDADTLTRLWYTNYYSLASTMGGPILPKFNGGPGLITRDDRSWGWGCWWQNTREMLWPLCTGNRLAWSRAFLDFYDRSFMDWKQQTAKNGKLGLRMYELQVPFKPGLPATPKTVSNFDAAALEKAMKDLTMENVKSGYNARSLAQSTELVQLMFDYVAYTGDREYLETTVAPWLKEVALFYMSYLRKDKDGLYHSMVTDAAEMWWKIKDSAVDLSAARYLFWEVLNNGEAFGYEPAFLAAVRERADKLPPLPVGQWNRKAVTPSELPPGVPPETKSIVYMDPKVNCYAPGADLYDDRNQHNSENPELYIVYPFAMVDANSPKADYERAVNTFRKRRCPNSAGWSQCPVQAARLHLDDAADVILDHVKRHQKYPYGGWNSPAGKLKDSKTGVTDTPYFDSVGVNLTAVQETLLQSHLLTTPEKSDPLAGGPIVLVPAVRKEWSGRFRLLARGGFMVTAAFEPGKKVTQATIECRRGGLLRLANPFGQCQVTRAGKAVLSTADAMIQIDTKAGDVVEFSWKSAPDRPAEK